MASPPADVVILGSALDTWGFEGNLTIAGLGLNTKGFLWPCAGIWQPSDDSSLTTTWTGSIPLVLVTNWISSDSPITTVWTASIDPNPTTEVCVDGDGSNVGLGGGVLGDEDGSILGTEDGDEIGT